MTRMQRFTIAAGVAAALLLLLSGPGTRLGAWTFRSGFTMLRWGAYLGIAVAVAALLQLALARSGAARSWPLLAALGLGVLAAGVPWYWQRRARQVPPIHDISTDTSDPPAFVAILPLRSAAPNPAEYEGSDVAAAQHQAYPEIRPLVLPVPAGTAYGRAVDAARRAGWEIVAADSAAGRIEATATTGWFGFKDDIVVRVQPAEGGSRVDVRSVSRVGKSDVGTNARRIRAYVQRLEPGASQ